MPTPVRMDQGALQNCSYLGRVVAMINPQFTTRADLEAWVKEQARICQRKFASRDFDTVKAILADIRRATLAHKDLIDE